MTWFTNGLDNGDKIILLNFSVENIINNTRPHIIVPESLKS